MSALETFVLQFETKGSKMVLSDIQQISEKTRNLEGLIHKETDAMEDNTAEEEKNTKARKKNANQITKQNGELWLLTKRLIGLGTIYAVLRKGWSLGIDFMKQGQGIKFMANSANMATGAFQKWTAVAKKFGGNENSVTSTMMGISSQIEEMRFGQVPMQEVAARYGISLPTTRDPEQFLLHLAKSLEGRRPEEQRQIGRQMGFGEDIIRMLQLGYKGLSAELRNAPVKLSNAQIEQADKLNKAMEEARENFSKIGLQLGSKLAPTILDISNMFLDLSAKVLPAIEGFIKIINESDLLRRIGEALASDNPFEALFGNFWEATKDVGRKTIKAAEDKASENRKNIAKKTVGWVFSKYADTGGYILDTLSGRNIAGTSAGMANNITINNENNVTLNGTEATPQETVGVINKGTEDSIKIVGNLMYIEKK